MSESPAPSSRRRLSLRWLGALSGLAGALAAAVHFGLVPLPGDSDRPNPEGPAAAADRPTDPVAVTVAAATPRAVERRVRTVGTLHGFEEIDIAPLVDGRVARVARDVGDVVVPGETLLEIDDADFRLAVVESSRGLELELAALGLSTSPDASFDIGRLPSVERAELVERDAAETLDRVRGLVERNAITKDEIQKAELALDTARLDRRQRVLEAERSLAAVRHREAVLETARKRLSDTRIVAPAIEVHTYPQPGAEGGRLTAEVAAAGSFTVAGRFVSEGEIVRAVPPTNLFRLVVEDLLRLRAAVPERHAAAIRPGQEVELVVESLPDTPVAGHVVRVNPTIDTASRTFEVEVQVPNGGRRLRPGAFAKAAILVDRTADAVTVPEEALVRFAGVTRLYVVRDGHAHAVPVTAGATLEVAEPAGDAPARPPRRWVEIPAGVPAGASVVTSGHAQITDGAPVRVRGAGTGS